MNSILVNIYKLSDLLSVILRILGLDFPHFVDYNMNLFLSAHLYLWLIYSSYLHSGFGLHGYQTIKNVSTPPLKIPTLRCDQRLE